MTTFTPVREAYRLWLLTAPQLTLEVDELSEPFRAATTPHVDTLAAANTGGSLNSPHESDPRTGAKLLSDLTAGQVGDQPLTTNGGKSR